MKKQNEYRPVTFCGPTGKWETGLFHEWGYNNMSVGIIEGEDGRVHTIFPWKIRFLDSQYEFDKFEWGHEEDEEEWGDSGTF